MGDFFLLCLEGGEGNPCLAATPIKRDPKFTIMLRISLFRKLSKADKKQTNPQWTRNSGVKRYVCLSKCWRQRETSSSEHILLKTNF